MTATFYQLVVASPSAAGDSCQTVSVPPNAIAYCDFNALGFYEPDEVDGYVALWTGGRQWEPGDIVELRDYDDGGPVCTARIVGRLQATEPFGATFHVLRNTWR